MKITNIAEKAEDFTGNIWFIDEEEKVLIDAGTGDSWESIKQLNQVDKVVITHSHYDHVDNLPKIVEKFSPEVYAYNPENISVDAKTLEDGDTIELSGRKFEVIHTPGHKNDSICLYSPEEKILFTSDLIFPNGSFGRTDLEEGEREILIESIEKIAELDVEEFYPGHDKAVKENTDQQIQKSLENAGRKESKY